MKPEIELIQSYTRRQCHAEVFHFIQDKIMDLFETDRITYPEEAEFIEAMIRMTERKNILELGMFTGFCTLHMIRAVYGFGHVTSVDCHPAHDREFFDRPEIASQFTFIEGSTPEILRTINPFHPYDFVFVDSDHTPEHMELERAEINLMTTSGSIIVFHDVPRIQEPGQIEDCPVRQYMNRLLDSGWYHGMILPTQRRLDLERLFGKDYDSGLNPHLAVLIRK